MHVPLATLVGCVALLTTCARVTGAAGTPAAGRYFVIEVVDAATGRGVPLVELETVNRVVHLTDSAGRIAFDEPGFMDREVYFHVRSHGYEYPKDFLGQRGVKLTPRAGTRATVTLTRTNIAERLYRITGAGIYRDSVLARLPVPLREPVLNAQVLGQDTVIVTPYRGKLHWFWGDTDQVAYPLGNFAASGATSELPPRGLPPAVGVDLSYFTDARGFAKKMCPDFGPGLHWIESVFTVPDAGGAERLVARVSSQKGLVRPHAWHLAVFNDDKQIFESRVRWEGREMHDAAHPFRARVDGVDYVHLYPNFRVRAELASALDPQRYEAFTCVAGDGKITGADTRLDRDPATNAPRYRWQAGADRLDEGRLRELIEARLLRADESWLHVVDFATGQPFVAGRGSVYWNEYRRRWIRLMGTTAGNVWYAEADAPTGPWGFARRVVAHHQYNFYNVTQHPFFDEAGGRIVYFEGTYTESFSGAKVRTPRYDYNQMMYRVALDDARLVLPEPVYQVTSQGRSRWLTKDGVVAAGARERIATVAWYAFAAGRAPRDSIAIFQDATGRLGTAPNSGPVLFHALPADPPPPQGIGGRWQLHAKDAQGGEIAFALNLEDEAGRVRASGHENSAHGHGRVAGESLTLTLRIAEHGYDLSATLKDGQLAGEWRRADGRESGTWRAHRLDTTPPEHRTAAIAPLHEYHRASDGTFLYSTDPALPAEGLVRSATPLCRVWRSPSDMSAADPQLFARRP